MASVDHRLAGPVPRTVPAAPRWLSGPKLRLVAFDLLAALIGALAGTAITDPGGSRIAAVVALVGAWWFWLARGRLYSSRFITRRSDELRRIVDAAVAVVASVAVVAFAFDLDLNRGWLGAAAAIGTVLIVAEREVVRAGFTRRRRLGLISRRIVMVGSNEEAQQLTAMFNEEHALGYDVVSIVDPGDLIGAGRAALTTKVLSELRAHDAIGVIVAATGIESRASNRLVRDLVEHGIHVELSSTLIDIDPSRLTVRPLGRFPVVYVEPVHRRGWRVLAKRSFDVLIALIVLVLTAPLLAVLALVIKLQDRGPVLFRQSRVGRDGEPFDMLKLRSMVSNAEELRAELDGADGALFKMENDPRITPIGRLIRKTSLDELPQLWNVVRGEMSLVGPRPALPAEMESWGEDLYGRLRVKPGITGMWQVSGRSGTGLEEYTRLDLYYVDNWSLVIDLAILLRTVPAVLKQDGAY